MLLYFTFIIIVCYWVAFCSLVVFCYLVLVYYLIGIWLPHFIFQYFMDYFVLLSSFTFLGSFHSASFPLGKNTAVCGRGFANHSRVHPQGPRRGHMRDVPASWPDHPRPSASAPVTCPVSCAFPSRAVGVTATQRGGPGSLVCEPAPMTTSVTCHTRQACPL